MHRAATAALCVAFASAGCGARTGLLVPVPDASTDVVDVADALDATDAIDVADVTDAADRADVCEPELRPVVRFSAEVVFVTDRSGSMAERTPSGVTRWQALTSALGAVLPAVDRELWSGLTLYPTPSGGGGGMCLGPSMLTLTPRAANGARILDTLRAAPLGGGTPTWDALRVTARYFADNPPLGQLRGRYIVLTTDGGPNCNAALDPRTCACTNPRGCSTFGGALSCLDVDRTVALLEDLALRGIPTFVVGTGPEVATMERLALAGGRPRPAALGGQRYYRAEDVSDFATNFREITTSLVRCRFVTNPVPAGRTALVRVGDRAFAEDPTRADGFAWERRAAGEFTLHGAACEAASRGSAPVRVEIPCAP